MQLAGKASWKIGVDEPQPLLIALYVRDATGLRPRITPDIPRLQPAVPATEEQLSVDSLATAQWAEWWERLLDGGGFWPDHKKPSDLPKLIEDPEIQRLFYRPTRDLASSAPSETPELQRLVHRHHQAAVLWSEARHHEIAALSSNRERGPLESEVVRKVERVLGRKARPFELDVRVLPVAATQAWRLSPSRALISRALYSDHAAYREWIQPIIEELA